MKTLSKAILLPMTCLMPLTVSAATLIENEDPDSPPKVWVDGSNIRMQMDATGQYMLVKAKQNKIYIVVPAERELIDASEFMNSSKNSTQGLNVKVDYVGKGPVIAGYATKKYNLSVNGQACEQTLVSKQALIDTRLGNLMEKLGTINFNPAFEQNMSACDRADGLFVVHMKKLGMPLGVIHLDGRMRSKVKRITKNVKVPTGGFKLPKGYRQITMQQKIQGSHGSGMPNNADMPPEMKRMMQEMMKQQ